MARKVSPHARTVREATPAYGHAAPHTRRVPSGGYGSPFQHRVPQPDFRSHSLKSGPIRKAETCTPPPDSAGGGCPVCTGPLSEIANRSTRTVSVPFPYSACRGSRLLEAARHSTARSARKLCKNCEFSMVFVALIWLSYYYAQGTFKRTLK
jgi:hypothetical protein